MSDLEQNKLTLIQHLEFLANLIEYVKPWYTEDFITLSDRKDLTLETFINNNPESLDFVEDRLGYVKYKKYVNKHWSTLIKHTHKAGISNAAYNHVKKQMRYVRDIISDSIEDILDNKIPGTVYKNLELLKAIKYNITGILSPGIDNITTQSHIHLMGKYFIREMDYILSQNNLDSTQEYKTLIEAIEARETATTIEAINETSKKLAISMYWLVELLIQDSLKLIKQTV